MFAWQRLTPNLYLWSNRTPSVNNYSNKFVEFCFSFLSNRFRNFVQIVKNIGIQETWFFGLQYTDSKNVECWLKSEKKVLDHDFPKGAMDPLTFKFRARFYPEDISEELYQDVTQVDRTIDSIKIDNQIVFFSRNSFIFNLPKRLLAAIFIVQRKRAFFSLLMRCKWNLEILKKIDINPDRFLKNVFYLELWSNNIVIHLNNGNNVSSTGGKNITIWWGLIRFSFSPKINEKWSWSRERERGRADRTSQTEWRKVNPSAFLLLLMMIHNDDFIRSFREDARMEYLKVVQDLEMYGVTYFEIQNKKKTDLFLGVDAFGLNIYDRRDK